MSHGKENESHTEVFRLIAYLYAITRVLRVHQLPSPFPLFPSVQFLPRVVKLTARASRLSQRRTLSPKSIPTWPRKTCGQHDQVDQHDQPQIGVGSLGNPSAACGLAPIALKYSL